MNNHLTEEGLRDLKDELNFEHKHLRNKNCRLVNKYGQEVLSYLVCFEDFVVVNNKVVVCFSFIKAGSQYKISQSIIWEDEYILVRAIL